MSGSASPSASYSTPGIGVASERNGVPESSSQRERGGERLGEADAPGEVLAEVVGLVGDHQRALTCAARPRPRRVGDPRVGDDDTVEAARRARRVGVGRELEPERVRRPRPLARQRRRRAGDHDPVDRPRRELAARELERRARLAGARRGRDQERARVPLVHRRERALLPAAQPAAAARPWSLCRRH